MPGQIKIDDGSGNYTILTNGGSLSSDKTITIPNTTGTMALTSDITSGLAQADEWLLTASHTGDGAITNTYARRANNGFGYIGSGMSVSSGVFTFPKNRILSCYCYKERQKLLVQITIYIYR